MRALANCDYHRNSLGGHVLDDLERRRLDWRLSGVGLAALVGFATNAQRGGSTPGQWWAPLLLFAFGFFAVLAYYSVPAGFGDEPNERWIRPTWTGGWNGRASFLHMKGWSWIAFGAGMFLHHGLPPESDRTGLVLITVGCGILLALRLVSDVDPAATHGRSAGPAEPEYSPAQADALRSYADAHDPRPSIWGHALQAREVVCGLAELVASVDVVAIAYGSFSGAVVSRESILLGSLAILALLVASASWLRQARFTRAFLLAMILLLLVPGFGFMWIGFPNPLRWLAWSWHPLALVAALWLPFCGFAVLVLRSAARTRADPAA